MDTLTIATLRKWKADRARELLARTEAARLRVDRGIADATAHARNALTATLRKAPEGRPTLAVVRRNPSYGAALSRLDELRGALVEQVESARVDAYRASWRFWCDHLPADVRRPGLDGPPADRVERCRVAVLHGLTLAEEIGSRLAADRARLRPALAVAGNRATPIDDGEDGLRRWGDRARAGILSVVAAALNDSLVMADRLAGRDVLLPELLHPDPSLPP